MLFPFEPSGTSPPVIAYPVSRLRGEHRVRIKRWAAVWSLPGLEDRVSVTFSRRFRSSLGRCAPSSGEIRLAAFLQDGPRALLIEALCHEAAHAAVHELHGHGPKPHGAEWRVLMQAAGYQPRARVPAALLEDLAPSSKRTRPTWLHRCPVCQASRIARRAVHRWRCAACVKSGLNGLLLIERVPANPGTQR